jgi:hypothetical protein
MTEDAKIYHGSCHCGAVAYDVAISLTNLITCNCSICQRKGSILGFVPSEKFTLKQGENNLTDYQFGKKTIHHLFCSTCGVTSFAKGASPDGQEMCAINIRCLEGVDVDSLEIQQFDGKNL